VVPSKPGSCFLIKGKAPRRASPYHVSMFWRAYPSRRMVATERNLDLARMLMRAPDASEWLDAVDALLTSRPGTSKPTAAASTNRCSFLNRESRSGRRVRSARPVPSRANVSRVRSGVTCRACGPGPAWASGARCARHGESAKSPRTRSPTATSCHQQPPT
jgi:hypothetical protein